MKKGHKIAVLFSGTGSNFLALINKIHKQSFFNQEIQISLAITNNAHAKGIEHAKNHNIALHVICHKDFATREEFDTKMLEIIKQSNIDLVVLAGFMRILTPIFTQNVKAINLHPSLLPLFKGANAINESFYSDMKVGGVSTHFVNEELDGGEIIMQKCFCKEGLDLQSYEQKIHSIEHEILPLSVVKVLTGQLP